MGSFEGHALPGSFFIVFGIWWTIQTARIKCQQDEDVRERKRKRYKYSFRTIFPCVCFGYNLPIESFMKVFFTFIGICIEIHSASRPHAVSAADNQHIIMYSMFFINGICEICIHYKKLVPKGADYFTGFLGFILEGILFWFHIEHQMKFEQTVHILLICTILLCALSAFVEAWIPDKLSFKYVRAFFVILQGTWFYQIGFLIYNPVPGAPKVWQSSLPHADNMWVSVIFSWHCITILIVQVILIYLGQCSVTGCFLCNSICKTKERVFEKDLPLINGKSNIEQCYEEEDDDNDDEEYFQQTKR